VALATQSLLFPGKNVKIVDAWAAGAKRRARATAKMTVRGDILERGAGNCEGTRPLPRGSEESQVFTVYFPTHIGFWGHFAVWRGLGVVDRGLPTSALL
jgi:hypothetical protein